MELMSHIATNVGKEGVLSVEFSRSASRRNLSLSFWEKKNFVMIAFTHCNRDIPIVKGNVLMIGYLLSVVSMVPTINSCGGADIRFVKALDRNPMRKNGLQYPFNLSAFQVEKLMHKPSFSLSAKLDMFSMLGTLLVRLSGML